MRSADPSPSQAENISFEDEHIIPGTVDQRASWATGVVLSYRIACGRHDPKMGVSGADFARSGGCAWEQCERAREKEERQNASGEIAGAVERNDDAARDVSTPQRHCGRTTCLIRRHGRLFGHGNKVQFSPDSRSAA
jgi:hypothetical protein